MVEDGTKKSDPTMWSGLLHSGLAGSFMKLPYVPPMTADLQTAGARAAIYGVPWDSTSISRTGANYGPRGMREISCQFLSFNATLEFDFVEALKPVDCGDASVILANAERTFANAEADIGEILDAGAIPVVMGGDHSVTIPAARAVARRYRDPALVLVDTHLDTAMDVGGERLNHCCPIPRAVEAGFPPHRIVLLAMSGWMNPRSELAYCEEHGITVIWIEDLWENGVDWVIERTLSVVGDDADGIYLSFDIDSVDAAYAVGTCVPTPGGLTSREAILLVRGIAARELLGFDLVEVAPSLDPTSMTSGLGARLLIEGMAFHAGASRRGADERTVTAVDASTS
jgi:agmatinase